MEGGPLCRRGGRLRALDRHLAPDTEVHCRPEADGTALVNVRFAYPAPEGPDWGWRIAVCERPSGELVLQMTNVTPWGEEARAVRMVFRRDG